MNTTPETPEQLLDALVGIVPIFRDEWEADESPESVHGVMLRFTVFFGIHASSSTPGELRRLGDMINRAVASGGLLANAMETCFLEQLHQIRARKTLRPYLAREIR